MNKKLINEMYMVLKLVKLFHNKDLFVTFYTDTRNDIHSRLSRTIFASNDGMKVRWHSCTFFYKDSDYNIRFEYDEAYDSILIDTSKIMSDHFINIKIGYSHDDLKEWLDTIGEAWKNKHFKSSKDFHGTKSHPQVMPQEEYEAFCRNELIKANVPMKEINKLFPLIKRVK